MKQNIYLVLILLTIGFSNTSFAQFYAKINGGYNFGMSGSTLGTNQIITQGTNNYIDIREYSVINKSLSEGFSYGAALGYTYKNFGIEVEASKHKLNPISISETLQQDARSTENVEDAIIIWNRINTETLTTELTTISPSLVFRGDGKYIKPYLKLGATIAFVSMNVHYTETYSDFRATGGEPYIDVVNREVSTDYSEKIEFGLNGGIGATYEIIENLSLFGEISYTNMSYTPEKAEIKEHILFGEQEDTSIINLVLDNKSNQHWTGDYIFKDEYTEQEQRDFYLDEMIILTDTKKLSLSTIAVKIGIMYSL